ALGSRAVLGERRLARVGGSAHNREPYVERKPRQERQAAITALKSARREPDIRHACLAYLMDVGHPYIGTEAEWTLGQLNDDA
ncbi:MAG TPA: hypothetical protein VHZ55_09270, partial [Bryobacteraceae bacterium]|nr:hypothetical protein [Bryobacteraceae bacterium]